MLQDAAAWNLWQGTLSTAPTRRLGLCSWQRRRTSISPAPRSLAHSLANRPNLTFWILLVFSSWSKVKVPTIGVLFGCFGGKIDGPCLPGGLIIYQGHLFPLKGHLWFQQVHHLACSSLEFSSSRCPKGKPITKSPSKRGLARFPARGRAASFGSMSGASLYLCPG